MQTTSKLLTDLKAQGIGLALENEQLKVRAPKGSVSKTMLERIRSEKSEIIKYLKGLELSQHIPKAPLKDHYPISSSQLRQYTIQRLKPESTSYNIPQLFNLKDRPDLGRFQAAFQHVISRHDSLRTSFENIDGEIRQKVHDVLRLTVTAHDVRSEDFQSFLNSFVRPFDLANAPLMRAAIVSTDDGNFYAVVDMHHIVSDGISNAILLHELQALYVGRTLSDTSPLRYVDYASWQVDVWFQSDPYNQQLNYWKSKISKTHDLLCWPVDYPREIRRDHAGQTLSFTLSPELTSRLRDNAKAHNTTLNTVLFSAYSLYVGLYCGQTSYSVGTLVSGRTRSEMEGVIGNFINYLPIYIRYAPEMSFNEFLANTGKNLVDAFDNQDVPYDKLLTIDITCPPDRNPLFDTMLVYHNEVVSSAAEKDAPIQFSGFIANHRAKLDLKVDVYEKNGGLDCTIEYSTDLYKRETIQTFVQYFQVLTEKISADGNIPVANIEVFPTGLKAILETKKVNEKQKGRPQTRINIGATFVAEPIKKYLQWWAEKSGYKAAFDVAPYNQVFQQLAGDDATVSADVEIILLNFCDWLRESNLEEEAANALLDDNLTFFKSLLKRRSRRSARIIPLLPATPDINNGTASKIDQLQSDLSNFLKTLPNTMCVDLRNVAAGYSINQLFDRVADREGHIPYTDEGFASLASEVFRCILALRGHQVKVIAVDCDNTLWQGVCGEDGQHGIQITAQHQYFQRFLVEKSREGFLIALISKNNENDVWQIFDIHQDMVLKKNHIAGWRINWNTKSSNLVSLAKELNLGLDSFLFLDDSLHECEEVKTNVPEVLTVHVPSTSYTSFCDKLWMLDKAFTTTEDMGRTDMYIQERARNPTSYQTVEQFVSVLNLEVHVCPPIEDEISRVSQITYKTNQFNLSTKRRDEKEIRALIDEGFTLLVIYARDRFGDYGLSGIVIARPVSDVLVIDSLMLSCRVLGRMVEMITLHALNKFAFNAGCRKIVAEYISTQRNAPILEFLKNKFESDSASANRIVFTRYVRPNEPMPTVAKLHYMERPPAATDLRKTALVEVTSPVTLTAVNSEHAKLYSDFNNRWADIDHRLLPLKYFTAESFLHKRRIPNHITIDVENVLKNIPGIQDSVVVHEGGKTTRYLIYYFAERSLSTLQLRKYLKEHNFDVIAFSEFRHVGKDKLDGAGKIDRCKIFSNLLHASSARQATTLELEIAAIWKEVLGVDGVHPEDNFFDLGGNSLLMVTTMSRLEHKLGVRVTLNDFFNQSLSQFATAIERKPQSPSAG